MYVYVCVCVCVCVFMLVCMLAHLVSCTRLIHLFIATIRAFCEMVIIHSKAKIFVDTHLLACLGCLGTSAAVAADFDAAAATDVSHA